MEDGGGKQAKVAIFLIARLPASKQTFVFEIRNSLWTFEFWRQAKEEEGTTQKEEHTHVEFPLKTPKGVNHKNIYAPVFLNQTLAWSLRQKR